MRLLLLGDPVDHSRSPAIHNAALHALGIEGGYTARRVDEEGMAGAVDEIRYGRLDGANVTMPHKELAFELADRVTADALRSGAVNTLSRSAGEVWGHNTDVLAVRELLSSDGFPPGAAVLVLGTGGAAAGALTAAADRTLAVSGRRPDAAADLARRISVDAAVVPWGTPIADAVVVNATPVGMRGESLPTAVLDGAAALLDMAYGPATTGSVDRARRRGIPVADGRSMLLAQAAHAFEIWTARPAPRPVMRDALRADRPATPGAAR